MRRVEFLEFAGSHGVPVINYDLDDFERELADIASGTFRRPPLREGQRGFRASEEPVSRVLRAAREGP